jgi:hypothetical protein
MQPRPELKLLSLTHLLFAVPLLAANASSTRVIEIYIPPVTNQAMTLIVMEAQGTADEIFSSIGVILKWRAERTTDTTCSAERMNWKISVAFSWSTQPTFHPEAMAYSRPFAKSGPCVTVFMDRLNPMVSSNPVTAAVLLGHVFAHELAHILTGTGRHSATGILKSYWSNEEIRAMPWRHLRFTDDDERLILNAIGEGIRSLRSR